MFNITQLYILSTFEDKVDISYEELMFLKALFGNDVPQSIAAKAKWSLADVEDFGEICPDIPTVKLV